MHLSEQHVRGERDKPANGISPGDGQRAAAGCGGGGSSSSTGGGGDGGMQLGSVSVQVSGKPQSQIATTYGPFNVVGLAGASFSKVQLNLPPLTQAQYTVPGSSVAEPPQQ